MAIERDASGITIYTGPHIRLYQLVAVKTRIKLEMLFQEGNPTKNKWAKYYGLPVRTKHEIVIAKINDEIDVIMRENPITKQEQE